MYVLYVCFKFNNNDNNMNISRFKGLHTSKGRQSMY